MRKCAISWSGGKDSYLARLRARDRGLEVATCVTMCEPDGSSKSHALAPELVAAQVARLGARWVPVRVAAGRYPEHFTQTLHALVDDGHERIVFGDIDLQAHRDWIEPICARAGIEPVFPLWGETRRSLATEIVERGIKAILVVVDTSLLDASFCGAPYDAPLLAKLPPAVCPCGEDGEFHTFVIDGPGMSGPLSVRTGAVRLVASVPPLRPTVLAVQELALV